MFGMIKSLDDAFKIGIPNMPYGVVVIVYNPERTRGDERFVNRKVDIFFEITMNAYDKNFYSQIKGEEMRWIELESNLSHYQWFFIMQPHLKRLIDNGGLSPLFQTRIEVDNAEPTLAYFQTRL